MPTVGRTLATERLRQRLDLDDIERVTKIPLRSLQYIETDQFDQLPGVMFARNFVRQYAECLRLDATAMVQQFNVEQTFPEPALSVPQPAFRVPRIGSSWNAASENSTLSAFIMFLATIVVCAGIYYAYQYLRTRPATPVAAASQATAPQPEATKVHPPPATTPVTPPATASIAPASVATGETAPGVNVAVSATAECWTRITADGKVLFEGTLNPGEKREVPAEKNVSIRAGNAGGLSIKLNGNEIPPIGPPGQIRTVILTPSGTQVIAPTPDPPF